MPQQSNPLQDNGSGQQMPPRSFWGVLRHLGPGIVIAGSIVGSGELIATTLLGAQAGFSLLWLILIGCVIKVFVQVEFGRHTILWWKTPLKALNDIGGLSVRGINWIVLYWVGMTCLVVTQQGGILGGIGEALAMLSPGQGSLSGGLTTADAGASASRVRYWTAAVALTTSVVLYFGRFALIQFISTVLVFAFTATSFINLALLQTEPQWKISWSDLVSGLSFQLPGGDISIALAAFALIGVGASELITYPYWCLEKGYAKFTGRRDDTPSWNERARGWIRIMRLDAFSCMVVYTFSTIAFYCMGAAVLGRIRLMPAQGDLIKTLAEMYVPVFGSWAEIVFVIGAIAVLYSTFFIVAAGHGRMIADAMQLFRLIRGDEQQRILIARRVSSVWPLIALVLYLWFESPVAMVVWSGIAQALMLPMLGFAALVFRYRRMIPALKPGLAWDVLLWISIAGMALVGCWAVYKGLFS